MKEKKGMKKVEKVSVQQLKKELQEQRRIALEMQIRAQFLNGRLNQAAEAGAQLGAAFETSQKIISRRNAELDGLSNKLQAADKAIQESAHTRRVAAQGLMLERHEMLNRAAKLAMRVRGLGFDPNTFEIEF